MTITQSAVQTENTVTRNIYIFEKKRNVPTYFFNVGFFDIQRKIKPQQFIAIIVKMRDMKLVS